VPSGCTGLARLSSRPLIGVAATLARVGDPQTVPGGWTELVKVPGAGGLVHVAAAGNPAYATHHRALCSAAAGTQVLTRRLGVVVTCGPCREAVARWLGGEP
jgi:hypothetical protein